jgi:hypothetical protein
MVELVEQVAAATLAELAALTFHIMVPQGQRGVVAAARVVALLASKVVAVVADMQVVLGTLGLQAPQLLVR